MFLPFFPQGKASHLFVLLKQASAGAGFQHSACGMAQPPAHVRGNPLFLPTGRPARSTRTSGCTMTNVALAISCLPTGIGTCHSQRLISLFHASLHGVILLFL
jgi:hypothetical protein